MVTGNLNSLKFQFIGLSLWQRHGRVLSGRFKQTEPSDKILWEKKRGNVGSGRKRNPTVGESGKGGSHPLKMNNGGFRLWHLDFITYI